MQILLISENRTRGKNLMSALEDRTANREVALAFSVETAVRMLSQTEDSAEVNFVAFVNSSDAYLTPAERKSLRPWEDTLVFLPFTYTDTITEEYLRLVKERLGID